MSPAKEKGLLCVGRFSDPHGVRGGIRLISLTERPASLKQYRAFYSQDGGALRFSFSKQLKDGFVISLEGVGTPEEAKKWKGREVFIKREELAELGAGEYYLADLEGLDVLTTAGEKIGRISGIDNFGAGDIIEVALKTPVKGVGKTLLLPFRGEVIKNIDLEKGIIIFDPEGWL